jgi:hypothetical protein
VRAVLSKPIGDRVANTRGQASWQIRHLALILRFRGMDWPLFLPASAFARTLNFVNASPWRQMAISFGAVGAIASIAIAPIWDRRDESPQAATQPRQHPIPLQHPESADVSMFKVFALSALLIPVLDDDVPSRWTEPFALMSCISSALTIDGKPVVRGARVPATSFSMRWSMNRCTALGEAFVMSGTVDLLVFHDGDSYSAVVQPTNLRLESSSGSAGPDPGFCSSHSSGNLVSCRRIPADCKVGQAGVSSPRRVPATRSTHDASVIAFPGVSLTRARNHGSYQSLPANPSK